jgi:diguanylate cyclase (GGDEF)-like protein
MLLFSGLRVAELLGLTWHDIDFNQHVIRVRYQMSRKGKRTPLKTDAGRRDVIMMNELARLLRKKRLSARFSADDDLIVGNGVGRTLGHTKLLKAFTKSASDAGIEGVTPHTCRHTFASILIDKGADVEFASDQLVDKGDEFARRVRGAAACERGRRLRESAGERRAAGSELVRCRVAARDLVDKATHDALAGLYNRAVAIDALTKALARAQRSGEPLALLHLDLDDFKRANDTHGHGVGDRILAKVAAQMTATVRGGEFIARVGGDEFVVITDRIKDTSDAAELAKRLIETVSEPIEVSGLSLTVGASVGVALALDGHEDPMQLLARADLAVNRAKQRGRGRVEQYDESLQRALLERADVEQALAVALRPDSDELVLHYQPLTRAETGTVLGVEALVRWNRPAAPATNSGARTGSYRSPRPAT